MCFQRTVEGGGPEDRLRIPFALRSVKQTMTPPALRRQARESTFSSIGQRTVVCSLFVHKGMPPPSPEGVNTVVITLNTAGPERARRLSPTHCPVWSSARARRGSRGPACRISHLARKCHRKGLKRLDSRPEMAPAKDVAPTPPGGRRTVFHQTAAQAPEPRPLQILAPNALISFVRLRILRGLAAPRAALVDAVDSPSKDGRPCGRPMDRVGRAQRARLQGQILAPNALKSLGCGQNCGAPVYRPKTPSSQAIRSAKTSSRLVSLSVSCRAPG